MLILGIESSCDETAAAVVEDGRTVLAEVVSSQIALHSPYGGVVPELASRRHVEMVLPVIDETLSKAGISVMDLDAIAVTLGPGLVGALLVGISTAKAMAYALNKPMIAVNHLEGHMHAAFLGGEPLDKPFVCLVVSGGHTALYLVGVDQDIRFLGTTRDDAAGEAFDKVAKILGLGYPGGVAIDKLAAAGNPRAFPFPKAYLEKDSLDFSFSGIKTAVANFVKRFGSPNDATAVTPYRLEDLVASFQEAVVEVLLAKTVMAATFTGVQDIAVVGGVSANRRLRQRFREECDYRQWHLHLPELRYCTDNAVMIAAAAYSVWRREGFCTDFIGLDAVSRWFH